MIIFACNIFSEVMIDKKGNTVIILGKQISSLQHIALIAVYLIFILFIWPLIAGSYVLVSGIVCFLPVIIANFFYDIFGSIKLYRKVIYLLIIILTFIYSFFLNDNSFMSALHYLVNLFFGYIMSRKNFFKDSEEDIINFD